VSFAARLLDARVKGNPDAARILAAAAACEADKHGIAVTADDLLSDPNKAAPIDEARRKLAVARAIERAKAKLGASDFNSPVYPVDALGALAPATKAIASAGQLSEAMAGQSLLGAAALLAQSRRDVQTLEGRKPLSLYLLTIAESGAGKTAAESVALRPIRELQREEATRHRAAIAASAGKDVAPRAPYRIGANATTEGIRRDFSTGVPSQGVFTSEAAAILSGYGMSAEHRAKSAAEFNALFDRGEVSVSRALAGRIELHDRRLSLHWAIQPAAARESVYDPLLSAMGFWPRFLIAWPQPAAPRTASPFHPEKHQAICDYWTRCGELLSPLGDDCADLPAIQCDTKAHRVMCDFFERMEREARTDGGALATVRPFALRATELAFRIAGVLATFEGRELIGETDARHACALALYSVETWAGLFGDRDDADRNAAALKLYGWLIEKDGATASAILQGGPRVMRSKDQRDAALSTLELSGLAIFQREFQRWIPLGVEP
jgi:hypothetical protein